jgi:hypothetical protein
VFTLQLLDNQHSLPTEASTRITSADRGFGDVVVVGDLDGDGIADAIVRPMDGSFQHGAALHVLYGGPALAPGIELTKLPTLVSALADDVHAIGGVSPAGDVNGDGLADFLVGVSAWPACGDDKIPEDQLHSGAYLLYGSTARFAGVSTLQDSGVLLRDAVSCTLGSDLLAGIGDIDGDGRDDFTIGRTAMSGDGGDGTNQLHVFYGRSARLSGSIDLRTSADAVITVAKGANAWGAIFAPPLAARAGDIDGDRFADWFVTVPTSTADIAEVRLVRGGAARLAGSLDVGDLVGTSFVARVYAPTDRRWRSATSMTMAWTTSRVHARRRRCRRDHRRAPTRQPAALSLCARLARTAGRHAAAAPRARDRGGHRGEPHRADGGPRTVA